MSDSGSDADRRKWTHKRAQFDNAVHSARLLGFVQKLASGDVTHQQVVETLVRVDSSLDQSQYIAEILAIKKELRDLTRREFNPEIAGFLIEASRLIPELTDGLASQIMMVLGHAGQNDAYLDTVSDAVSELLADLDHPPSTDARNYLRLLWDQMEATRRLKQTEAQFVVPSPPPASDPPSPQPRSPVPASPQPRSPQPRSPAPASPPPASPAPAPSEPASSSPPPSSAPRNYWADSSKLPKPRESERAASQARPPVLEPEDEVTAVKASSPASIPKAKIHSIASPTPNGDAGESAPVAEATPSPVTYESSEQTITGYKTRPMPVDPHSPPDADAVRADLERQVTLIQFAVSPPAVVPEDSAEPTPSVRVPSVPPPNVLEKGWDDKPDDDSEFKVPTRSIPRWAIVTAVVAVSLLVAAVVYFIDDEGPKPAGPMTGPSANASAAAPQTSASAKAGATPANSAPRTLPPPTPPPAAVPQEPPASVSAAAKPTPRTPPEPHAQQVSKPPAGRVAIDAVNVPTAHPSKSAPAVVASAKPSPAVTAEPESRRPSAAVVTPPEVAKNMSPLDRIIAELRIISPDPLGIEDKARELSRIIASSKRKDAFYIIDHLGPAVALDSLGRDPALEETLRTFAISTLGRVAMDDDDNRAVSAIYMLGEWAKSGGKGRQKAIAALESLSKDNGVKSSTPRAKALRAAKAQIED